MSAIDDAARRLAVLVPNYNHARFLPDALDALLAQEPQPRKICVIDDASTDDSRAVIASYAARHPHIRPVFLERNRGVLRNLADWLAEATDEFVFFAAADDKVLPGLFARSLALLSAHPQAGLCSAPARLIDEAGRDIGPFPTPRPLYAPGYIDPAQAARILLRDDSWMIGNTTIYRRTALVAAGGFRPELSSLTDGYASRAVALRDGACFLPEALACWRRDDAGLAGQTAASIDKSRAVAEAAEALMRGEHAALFPPSYAARWRGRWMFGALRQQVMRGDKPFTASLRRALERPTPLDNVFLPLLDLLRLRTLALAYGFLRLRPYDAWRVAVRHLLRRAQ
ncbi:MAG: glycosyltransferase family A protein [Alphaproteobacteria bacterium]